MVSIIIKVLYVPICLICWSELVRSTDNTCPEVLHRPQGKSHSQACPKSVALTQPEEARQLGSKDGAVGADSRAVGLEGKRQ